jgi:hypothetical protein
MRLIDADALIDAMTKFSNATGEDMTHGIFYAHIAPTIEAQPVRHGKWIGYAGTIGNECSVCGKWIDVLQGTAEMNYCPNCGARMDEE